MELFERQIPSGLWCEGAEVSMVPSVTHRRVDETRQPTCIARAESLVVGRNLWWRGGRVEMSASLALGRVARDGPRRAASRWGEARRGTYGGARVGQASGRGGGGTRGGAEIRGGAGIIGDSGKLSLYDSSHLTAVVPAGKLEPELLNFTLIIQARDCSWHVR
jgi:hypothetical protein